MYNIWADNQSEIEWYKKMNDLLIKHDLYNQSDLWDIAISKIYSKFCELACGESAPGLGYLIEECGHSVDEIIEGEGIGLTLEMIQEYMIDYKITEITKDDFEDMFDYCRGGLIERLYEVCEVYENKFWTALSKEYKSTYEKLLFLYVREEHFEFAVNCYNPSASLGHFVQNVDYYDEEHVSTEDEDEATGEDGEKGSLNDKKVKTTLYSFVNNDGAYSALRVYEWIEYNTRYIVE